MPSVGYRTAMLGKYLNGYQPTLHAPAPGWTLWAVAGNGYAGFNYALNRDGNAIFTGRYPHNTGIFRNQGADGGYLAFHNRGHEGATFATALSAWNLVQYMPHVLNMQKDGMTFTNYFVTDSLCCPSRSSSSASARSLKIT